MKFSLKKQISTSCWLRKCYSLSVLPRTPHTFQQAGHRSLLRSILLGCASIFGHEQNNVFQDRPGEAYPCGEGADGREEQTRQLHTCLERKVIEAIRDLLECGGGILGRATKFSVVILATTDSTFATDFLGLHRSRLRGGCKYGLSLLRPGRLPDGSHFRLIWDLRDQLRRGIWIWKWSGCGFKDAPPSDEVIPLLAEVHLHGRCPRPLIFQKGKVACGGALSSLVWRLLYKSRPIFFPRHTAPVVRRLIPPQPQH